MKTQRAEEMVNYNDIYKKVKDKSPDTVLVAVSKTKPIEAIMEAYQDGARIFGENRVQEIVAKFSQGKKEDMKVYLIGQLQSNKVKKAVLYPVLFVGENRVNIYILNAAEYAFLNIGIALFKLAYQPFRLLTL